MNETQHQRFLAKLPPEREKDSCWLWLGSKRKTGYGNFHYNGKQGTAHRYSYEYHKGVIPKELEVDHECNNPSCVNPMHLRLLTPRENTLRGNSACALNARKKVCIRGHKFAGKNLFVRVSTKGEIARKCMECSRLRNRKWRLANKEALTDVLEKL